MLSFQLAQAQTGYIYVHTKAIDESSSVDFTFNVSGGSTSVPAFQLNDNPTQTGLRDIGASQGGRLWAIATADYRLYYRDPGSSTWVATSINNAWAVDGGPGNTCFIAITDGGVISFDGTTSTALGAKTNFGGENAFDIGSTWDGRPYIITNALTIWRYSGSGTSWAQVGTSNNNRRLDGNPATGNIIVNKTDNIIYSITPTGTATSLGRPYTPAVTVADVAADGAGNIFAIFSASYAGENAPYKWSSGTSWGAQESTARGAFNMTGGPVSQMWMSGHDIYSPYGNIYSRTLEGSNSIWIDDERVRTSPVSNSEMIAVTPGTYTVTETVPSGWDLQDIDVNDPTSNSSATLGTKSATVNVAAGEVVHLVFQNGLVNPFSMTNNCGSDYLETFGTGATGTYGAALTGQTAYHYKDGGSPLDGYYNVVSQAKPDWGSYAEVVNFYDHTTNNGTGRFMGVNAAYNTDEFFRRRMVNLIPGAKYTFSAWLANLTATATIKPNATFTIFDATTQAVLATYSTGNITSSTWTQYATSFTATSSSIDLVIKNNAIGGQGNDIALDDIGFSLAAPAPPVVAVSNGNCATGGTITVTSPTGSIYEYSRDGTNWQTSTSFTSTAPGSYTISARYVGSTGCVSTTTTTVLTSVCGTVWNDTDRNVALNGSETGTNAGTTLYVNLLNASNTVIGSTTVASDGTYSLTSVALNTSGLKLVLTNSATSTTPGPLPTGYSNTGETVGPGNTATQDATLGVIQLTTGSSAITAQNFGIAPYYTVTCANPFTQNFESLTTATATANFYADPVYRYNNCTNFNGIIGKNPTAMPTFSETTPVDHTSGTGNYLMNGTPTGSSCTGPATVWGTGTSTGGRQPITVIAGQTVTFSAWYTNISPQAAAANASLRWSTNGTTWTVINTSASNTRTWQQISGTFVAPSNQIYLDIYNSSNQTTGNDLGLDDIVVSVCNTTVAGTVWHDADGNVAQNGSEPGTNTGGTLYVNLVDVNNTVIGSTTVASNGTYTLSNVPTNLSNLKLVLTSTASSTAPGGLPTGWVNTGEVAGTNNTATQSTTLGQIELTTGTSAVTDANFGIEQLPTPGSGTATAVNAGGASPVTVPPTAFTSTSPSTDTAPGSVTAIRITAFPTNTTSLTINGTAYSSLPNGGITVPTDGNGTPTVPILVNPTNDANPVVITFVAVDNAGKPSTSTGTATINSTAPITISGTVWNDADGNLALNGSETGTNTGGTLYVNLVDASNTVVSSTTVASNGTYSLANVPVNTTGLKLVLTNSATSTTPGTLPTGWVNTGENVGAGNTATQSTTLGQIELTTGTSNVTAQNFGIEQLPTPGSGSNTVVNNGGTTPVTVPATTFSNTTPSTDTAPGSVTAIRITVFPTNTTSLTVNGTTYTSLPNGGITVPTDGTGAPTVPILVDPTNDVNPVVFTYAAVDNAGKESTTTGTATINSSLLTTISGTVWDDVDGNVALNGSETGTNTGATLYVNLVNGAGTVVGSTTVASNGTYSLTGVPTNVSGYKLVLTNSATSNTPGTLPTGWVNTGENVDPSNTATQSTTLGQIELTIGTSAITAQNFGIEHLPTPGSGSNTVANAGGTTLVTVPATTFTNSSPSSDAQDTPPGSVTAIRITALPSNTTTLVINGMTYNSGNFPGPGITVPTDGAGNPTVPISVDPTNDANPVVIAFVAIDNAGKESTTTGTATINSSLVASVSGTVWNDADGNLNLNGSETGTNMGGTLYVNLVNGSGTVVGSTTVASDGTYTLMNVPTNVTGYKLVLTNSATSTTPGPLPTGWVNTGENVGSGNTATQSTTVGQIELTVSTSSIAAQNFGIEVLPTPGSGANTVANAGGTSPVTVPASTFTNTTPSADTAPGSVTAIHITAFPGNVTSLTINGASYTPGTFPGPGVTVPTDGSGNPTVPILVDPTNDANPVVITFVAVDNAGKESTTSGTATINSSPVITVSGTVWNDADGNLSLNGSEVATNAGGPLYVNLVDATGTVITSTTVATNGTYSLSGVPANTNGLKLVLTNTSSSTAPGGLPSGWVNTGENVDPSNTATQSTTLGQIELTTGTSPVTAQNFGIEQIPNAGSGANTVSNGGGTSPVTVPASTFSNSTPSTDTAPGSVTAIRITTFPANVTSLTVNGTTYTVSTFPGTGVIVPTNGSGNPTVPILVDPTNDANPVVIPFVSIDNAGKESSNTGTATINSSLVTTVSGTVWNDADGNVALNGSETGTNMGGTLYVNLVDGTGTVVGSTTVASNGSYSLSGVPTNVSGYKLVLTNSATSTSPGSLPTGWVNTGDNVDPSNTATQSTTLGQIELTVGTSSVIAQNFGIEQLPSAGGGSNTVSNAGGTTPVTVPANTFTNSTPSTDTAPGSVTALRITSFPGNVTSLTINGSVYNAGNFPGQGVTVPTDGSGNPTIPILVDPTNDANPVVIPFVAIDNAGKDSPNTGTATISAAPTVSLSGHVFDDANGLTDNTVNGTAVNGPSLPVYVSLVQAGAVVSTVPVQANGTYAFSSVSPGSYSLVITTSATGSTTTSLPASWSSTGENLGTTAASDGNPNGVLAVTVAGSSLTEANFGIDRLPTANPVSQTYTNPGGTVEVQVPTLAGSDPEDGTYNGTSGTNTVIIQSLPTTPAGSPSGVLYYAGNPVAVGDVISNYTPSELTYDPVDGPGSYTFAYSQVDAAGLASLTATATMSFTVAVPDLAPIIYALPATQYNTTNTTVVVDVFELNNVATSGLITVAISKDPLVSLNFNPAATFVGGRPVNNSIWTFNNTNPNFYIFTTTQVIDAGDVKSIGMTGVTTPGNTQGVLTLSTTIVGGSGGESRIDNNSDADKIDYFKK